MLQKQGYCHVHLKINSSKKKIVKKIMRISELEHAINTVPTVRRHTDVISFVGKDNCQVTLYNLFWVRFADFNKQRI